MPSLQRRNIDARNARSTFFIPGKTTIFTAGTGGHGNAWDEAMLDAAESRRTMDLMPAFLKQVNASDIDPAFLAKVGKKLDLGQRQAGEIFGGGAAFSRYQSGKSTPPLALVKLLKVPDCHPYLSAEVRTM